MTKTTETIIAHIALNEIERALELIAECDTSELDQLERLLQTSGLMNDALRRAIAKRRDQLTLAAQRKALAAMKSIRADAEPSVQSAHTKTDHLKP